MKRVALAKKLLSITLLGALLLGTVNPVTAHAYTVTAEYKQEETITEGVYLRNISYLTPEGPLNIDVLEVDLTNPYVKVDTIYGAGGRLKSNQAISKMAKENGAVAAINAGFFERDEKAPINTTVQGGQIISSPAQRNDMSSFGIIGDKYPVIDIFKFSGTVTAPNGVSASLFGINKPEYLTGEGSNSITGRLNMYTPAWGQTSRGLIGSSKEVTELVVDNNVVMAIRQNLPGVPIPANGYILSGEGSATAFLKTNFKVGDPVLVSAGIDNPQNISMAVGGQSKIVDYGQVCYMPQNIGGKLARTAIGYTQDRKRLFMVVVEGTKKSRGMTQEEVAQFMVSLGCWQALNLDGGGSSTFAARGLGDEVLSLMNSPKDGVERPVPDGLGIFSTAPAGSLLGLKLVGDKTIIINTSRGYTAKGYDEHYNPYKVDPARVSWTVSPELGTFNGNTLTASKGGEGVLTATVGNVTQSIPISVIDSVYIAKIEAAAGQLAVNEGVSVPLELKVITKSNQVFAIDAKDMQWEITGEIGQIVGSNFVAGVKWAVGELIGKLDQTVVRIPVVVGSKAQEPFYYFEQPGDLKFEGYPKKITGSFSVVGSEQPVYRGAGSAILTYDFGGSMETRAAYGRFSGEGITLPGKPVGFGLWVYGDQGNGHWLRAKVEDNNGIEKTVDLATKVNWQGWRQVVGKLPAGLEYPLKLNSIYLVESDPNKQDKGQIFLDELFTLNPIDFSDLNQPGISLPGVEEQLNPKEDVEVELAGYRFNFPAGAVKSPSTITIQQEKVAFATPGMRPVDNALRVSLKDAPTAALTKSVLMNVSAPSGVKLENLTLKRWDASKGWVYVPHKHLADGTVKGKFEATGLYGLFVKSAPVKEFNDTADNWAREEIKDMSGNGVVKGLTSNKFGPKESITRAQFVTILARALGWQGQVKTNQFKDKIPDYAKDAVNIAVAKGVVAGFEDQTFRPNAVITRVQMAAIIDRALSLPVAKNNYIFADDKEILKWAKGPVSRAQSVGLLKGKMEKFKPNDTATRAEATVVIYRMINYYVD